MKRDDVKVGSRVVDRWYRWWGSGIVKAVLKTRIKVQFTDHMLTYDVPHLRFLEHED